MPNSNYLERVFENKQEEAQKNTKRQAAPKEQPDDVKLAIVKTQKRMQEAQSRLREEPGARTLRIRDQMDSADLQSNERSRVPAGPRQTRSSPRGKEVSELAGSAEIPPRNFYRSSSINQPDDIAHETRSSARLTEKSSHIRFAKTPQRSPSPERWTQLHPEWKKTWQTSVVYPRRGRVKATVDKQDIERLDEGQFLNDNLIEFYIRWLEHNLLQGRPEIAKRVYFLNTFFYERLTISTRGKRGINYEAVQRWTAKIDLLSYDYIVVPVNEHSHWYLAIICNAPKLLTSSPEMAEQPQGKQESAGAGQSNAAGDVKTESSGPLSSPSRLPSSDVDLPIKDISLVDKIPDEKGDDHPGRSETPILPPASLAKATTSNSDDRGREAEKPGSPEYEFVTSDLPQALSQKPNAPKKGKKKPQPVPRKYNPEDPRIITLDSLGLRHSPTCTNLKEYLIAEIKSKRGIDIPPPGSLGMTATNIPQQDNFCDCGLFLLSYVEMFLERPDEFVHNILQNISDIETQWPKASDMRNKIRDLLLNLQSEQVEEMEKFRILRNGDKKVSSESSKAGTEPESRDASKSTSSSATPKHDFLEAILPQNAAKQPSPQLTDEVSMKYAEKQSPFPETVDLAGHSHPEQETKAEFERPVHAISRLRSPSFEENLAGPSSKMTMAGGDAVKEKHPVEILPARRADIVLKLGPSSVVDDPLRRSIERAPTPRRDMALNSPSPSPKRSPRRAVQDRRSTPYSTGPGPEHPHVKDQDTFEGADDEMLFSVAHTFRSPKPQTPRPPLLSDPSHSLFSTSTPPRRRHESRHPTSGSPRRHRDGYGSRQPIKINPLDAADHGIVGRTHIKFTD